MKKQKGFSLIELLIVVAIILIIAAIAVPNLLRSRMAANESSAAGSERTLATSNVTYSTTYGIGFASVFSYLGPPAGGGTAAVSDGADLIDTTLASGAKSGYGFGPVAPGAYSATDANTDNIFESYTSFTGPVQEDVTGKSVFCVDQTNVIYKDPGGTGGGTTDGDTPGVNCNTDNTGLVPMGN